MKKSVCLLVSALLFVLAPLSSLSSASLTQPWSNKLVDNAGSVVSIILPKAVAGANGETFILWEDNKEVSSVNYYGYVQKLDASGNELWTDPVRVSSGQIAGNVVLVSDTNNNLFIAWQDVRHDPAGRDRNLYVQKIDSDGNVKWTAGGVAVCTATGDKDSFDLAPDGSGGAILAWSDERSSNKDIYAQKIASVGSASWTANGVLVCNAADDQGNQVAQSSAKLIVAYAGEPIITWQDGRGMGGETDIYAQKLDTSGLPKWTANGNAVCSAASNQSAPWIVTDGAAGATFFWQDWATPQPTIRAQQLDASGAIEWPPENPGQVGVLVTGSSDNAGVESAVYAGAAGYLVTWAYTNTYTDYDVRAQKLDATGVSQWTVKAQYEVCNLAGPNSQSPQIVPDGSGGALIAWRDDRTNSTDNVYVQRKSDLGSDLWADDGVAFASSATIAQAQLALASDGSSGAVCAWVDSVGGTQAPTAKYQRARRVQSNGSMAWAAGGVELDKAEKRAVKKYPRLIANGDPATDLNLGAWIIWEDYRYLLSSDLSKAFAGIHAQRINGSGVTQWADSLGVPGSTSSEYFIPAVIRTTDGMAFEGVPRHIPSTSSQLLLGQKVNEAGAPQWVDENGDQAPLLYMNVSGRKYYQPCGAPDSTGGGILAWVYEGVYDGVTVPQIYSKAFDTSGSLRAPFDMTSNGLPIAENNDAYPAMTYMGQTAPAASGVRAAADVPADPSEERAWIVWDHQDVNNISNLRVQETAGVTPAYEWADIVAFSSSNNQYWPDIDKSGVNEAVIVWSEKVGNRYIVKAQKLGYSGASGLRAAAVQISLTSEEAPSKLWASDVAVSDTSQDAIYPKVAVLPNGAIVIVWQGGGPVPAQAAAPATPFTQPTFGRPTPNLTDTQIYMQVLTPGGEKILAGDLEVTTVTDTQYPDVAASGTDSAIVAWARNTATVGEVRTSAFSNIPASISTTTTTIPTTTTTTGTTTTTIKSIVINPSVDRIRDSFKFAKTVSLQAEGNVLYGENILPGAEIKFINSKTGYEIIAKNIVFAPDYKSAQFDIDMPAKTNTPALGRFHLIITNVDGGTIRVNDVLTIEYPEGEIFFYPTRLTEASIKAAAPQDRPRVAYSLSVDKEVDIYIYDVRSMRVVYHRRFAAGTYGGQQGYNEIMWDGTTDFGTTIANGSYVLQAFSGGRMIGQTYFVVTD